ncbi:MAG: phosphate signaling complex protein PhoU [Defluviitaleaceae bacterium]|nr:phosphate signaling complex protein PhoU [Defluviitaleaceae bacterium]
MSVRRKFDEQLETLSNCLIEMGATLEQAISKACRALLTQDIPLAEEAMQLEIEIDTREREIENLCMKLLMQQQPVAKDLRQIHAALKMITDMERIGDHARDISEITIFLSTTGEKYIKRMDHITAMADATIKMVTDSVEAFVRKDIELAKHVIEYDDVVDDLFTTIKDELYSLILADVKNGTQALDLLMIAKYFERIGDHAVNIAEWVLFSITGGHVKNTGLKM